MVSFSTFVPNYKRDRMKIAEIHTSKGIMKVKFFEEDAPSTVANFIKLSRIRAYYDGLTFHRCNSKFCNSKADALTVLALVAQDTR